MVSFRLSAEEYERIVELCSTCGTRSISELARVALYSLLKQPGQAPREALESRVVDLEGRVNMLRLEFKKLRQSGSVQSLEQPNSESAESSDTAMGSTLNKPDEVLAHDRCSQACAITDHPLGH